jgi:hypothetical protein
MIRILWGGLVVVAAAVLTACSGSETTGPGQTGLSGNWRFEELLANAEVGLSCTDTAQVAITQTGQAFTATYAQVGTCSAGGQLFDNSGTGTISNGRVAGDSVTFSEDFCAYRGTLAGSPVNGMSGSVVCSDTTATPAVAIPGSWTMSR